MKKFALLICIAFITNSCLPQSVNNDAQNAAAWLSDLFAPDSKTNMDFALLTNCPVQFANSIFNTNLFESKERQLLESIFLKYKQFDTNSRIPNAILTRVDNLTNVCLLHFQYTNADAGEDIIFRNNPAHPPRGGGYEELVSPLDAGSAFIARFRSHDKSGYDAIMSLEPREMSMFAEIENDKINGHVIIFGGNNAVEQLLNFKAGQAVGEWLFFCGTNSLVKIRIGSKLDYFHYFTQEVAN